MTTQVLLQAITGGVLMGSIYGLVAMGFTLVFGVMGFTNFAHGHLVAIGMFASLVLHQVSGMDPFVSLLLVVPFMFALGAGLYKLLVRRVVAAPPAAHMMLTLGLLIILENLMGLIFGGDQRAVTTGYTTSSIALGLIRISLPRLFGAVAAVLAMFGLYSLLHRTDIGKAARAAANNRVGALLSGIDTEVIFAFTLGLGTAAAGLAGSAIVPFGVISPYVGNEMLLRSFAIVVLGGMRSIHGAMVGGVLVGLVESVSTVTAAAPFSGAMVYLLMILILLFRPSGLFGRADL